MSITPHVMAGFVTAVNFEGLRLKKPLQNKWLIYFLMCLVSLATHLFLDRIPHFDYSIYGPDKFESGLKLFVDAALALLIIKCIFELWARKNGIPNGSKILDQIIPGLSEAGSYWIFALATFFCLVPDLIAVLAKNPNMTFLHFLSVLHDKNHTSIIPGTVVGLTTQLATIIILWYFLKKSLQKLYQYKLEQKMVQIDQEWLTLKNLRG